MSKVNEYTESDFGVRKCAGPIPTELGQLTAMNLLNLANNKLTGRFLFAHRMSKVNESTFLRNDVLMQAGSQPKLERFTSSDN